VEIVDPATFVAVRSSKDYGLHTNLSADPATA
jgi:hypothetical protein